MMSHLLVVTTTTPVADTMQTAVIILSAVGQGILDGLSWVSGQVMGGLMP